MLGSPLKSNLRETHNLLSSVLVRQSLLPVFLINIFISLDNVLSGSNNKIAYEETAKRHVRSAMEGFNAVVFAYGQTASGKTFTLVKTHAILSHVLH